MSASLLLILALAALGAAYVLYGRFLARTYGVDPARKTPAHTKQDGVDYVPTKMPVLMGHHFASIAGAAPILGPIFAVVFGWAPVLLWILLGSIFLGGAHDFSSLMASLRHGGKTIGEVIEDHIGEVGKKLFLIFGWSVLVLVIATFVNAVTAVFVREPSTSTASILFIVLALVFGLSVYRLNAPLWLSSAIGLALLAGCVLLGGRFPIRLEPDTWKIALFVYVFFAAVAPVWILLQPRDYLSSFLLYAILIGGVIGILIANPTIKAPAFTSFHVPGVGLLFPLLFVMVACGAISGFHSLVSSGTTAKQLNSESDARPVAYGSMLIEGLLAVIALITAITILQSDYAAQVKAEGGGPIAIFSSGIGRFVSRIGIPESAGVTFAALAISAFALTTLDTATRLGRFMFQEFFEGAGDRKTWLSQNRYVATLATIGVSMLLTFSGKQGALWPLFGSANQLLASLALLAVTVWLTRLNKENRFVRYPMYFMFCVTLSALVLQIYRNLVAEPMNLTLVIFSALLFVVAATLVVNAVKSLRSYAATKSGGDTVFETSKA
jgi:carbon starvation protein